MNQPSQQHITELISTFSKLAKADWRKTTKWGIKASELRVLLAVKDRTDHNEQQMTTVSELSKVLEVTSPTVTQMVNALIKEGLVERTVNRTDRRYAEITLTDKGSHMAEQARVEIRSMFAGLVEHLGEAQSQQLVHLLNEAYGYFKQAKQSRQSDL
ncbi:MarR family winged helix-turn-helix transcriptional regulator [Paenibacillus sp. YYML68]|uniref:MarR family winged helix-turn-helix transcriptional regulator n=1 Tax=Paenibacillus sp. YYML68 TaxID=2909250 RepID=UPI002493404A|nr:MarR family transcriptional regulator [Paenibacillus sp. YYML68]